MGRAHETFRLFAAMYPPLEIAQAMLAEAASVCAGPHRFVRAEQVHLTLLFIGETGAREVREVAESLERAAAGTGPIELAPRELITLPQRGEARLLAAETDAPGALVELHKRAAQRLASRVRPRDCERFLPHLTLVRFDHQQRMAPVRLALMLPAFTVERVRLMRSHLTRRGAAHEEVCAVRLGA